jgi:hypothetical protein
MLGVMELKRTLLVIAVPAALILGGATVIAATPTPTPRASHHATQPAEAPDATTEAPDAADAPEAPGAAQFGHADNPADANADHQFDGQE